MTTHTLHTSTDNPTLTITHTPTEGTLIEGTARGDGSAEVLKRHRWRWGRTLGAWYLPRTRDQHPKTTEITATAEALRAAGFEVHVQIDDQVRDVAQVETDRIERQAQRVQRLAARAERAQAAAAAGWARHDRAAAQLPPGGEPIKLGHHSAPRHQRAAEKSTATAFAALELDRAAAHAEHRATAAASTTSFRYNGQVIGRRIERLAADHRKAQRNHQHARAAELAAELAFWRAELDQQVRSGQATVYGPDTVRPGDLTRINGRWYEVVRANTKTVAVQTPNGTRRAPWTSVDDHRHTAA